MSWKQLSCFLLLSLTISSLFLGNLSASKAKTNSESEVLDPQVTPPWIPRWNITTTSCSSPTKFNHQHKAFYACGWQFVFYSNGSDMLYSPVECHVDETRERTEVVRKGNGTSLVYDGSQFSICWDGTYVHYALFLPDPTYGGKLCYRRGVPLPHNHTIMWEEERIVWLYFAESLIMVPVISVDSNGYPWIGVQFSGYVEVFKASTKDGSSWNWMRVTYYGTVENVRVDIVPLSNGKVYIIYAWDGIPVKGRLWNGSSLEIEEIVSASIFNVNGGFSAVAEGDDIHLVFGANGTYDIKYVNRTNAAGWGGEVTIQPIQSPTSSPCIVLGPTGVSSKLLVFWIYSDTIYMKMFVDGAWSNTPSTPFGTNLTGTSDGASNLVCFYRAGGRGVGVAWRQGTQPGPYSVIYGFYEFAVKVGDSPSWSEYWYYWNASSDKAVVIFFGGGIVWLVGWPEYGVVPFNLYGYWEYSIEKENFVEDLYARGYNILTPKEEMPYYGWQEYLPIATVWLKNQGCRHVFLFGFSAGGIWIAHEIQKDYATNSFTAAVIASAPVNCTSYPNSYGLFLSAQNASKAKVCTCLIAGENDMLEGNITAQMRLYYDNMIIHKQWHTWTDGHDVFLNKCKDHPNETVLDVAYDWYQHTHALTVQAQVTGFCGGEINGTNIWVDGNPISPSPVTINVSPGIHTVQVESLFNRTNPDNQKTQTYAFDHWEENSTSNPRTIGITSNKTIKAYYAWTIDLRQDSTIDIFDIVIIGAAFGSTPGDPNWNPIADIVHDNVIDIFDIVAVADQFGDKSVFWVDPPPESSSSSNSAMTQTLAEQTTVISTYPSQITVNKYETFSVDIVITNATNLYGWELKLYWNNAILNCTNAQIHVPTAWGQNIFEAGTGIENTFNATHGRYWKALSALNPAPTFNGSMAIATLTFKAKATGTSALALQETKLSDSEANPITHTTIDGSVVVVPRQRFMRGDTHTINGLLAYKLGTAQSSIAKSSSQTIEEYGLPAYWGIQVWKRNADGTETSLTSGVVAQVSRTSQGQGIQSATWNCPTTSLNPTDAIVVRVYQKIGNYDWQLAGTFTTEQLGATQLDSSTWQIYYYTKLKWTYIPKYEIEETTATFYWGTTTYNSYIKNFEYN